jgi:hypothetical protein
MNTAYFNLHWSFCNTRTSPYSPGPFPTDSERARLIGYKSVEPEPLQAYPAASLPELQYYVCPLFEVPLKAAVFRKYYGRWLRDKLILPGLSVPDR